MTENQLSPRPEPPSAAPSVKIGKIMQQGDFWLGFCGSIVLNVLIFFITANMINNWVVCLPWAANFGAIILPLVLRRPRITLGVLASYVLGFVLALVTTVVVCFSLTNS